MVKKSIALAISFILLIAVGGFASALPQAAGPQPSAQSQAQNEFVPLKDLPKQEQLPAAPLVMGAYAFVWVALLIYVWSLWRRVTRVQHELRDLRQRTGARK